MATGRLPRFLNSGSGLAVCLLLGFIWVLVEKAAVNYVSRPVSLDIFHARDYHNSDSLWRRRRFTELIRNHSLDPTLASVRRRPQDVGATLKALKFMQAKGLPADKDKHVTRQLQAEFLDLHASISVLESRLALAENRDVLHSVWLEHCHKPGKTRICDDDSVLRPYISLQTPPAAFAVYAALVCFLAVASAREFVAPNHLILTLVVSRLFRTITFLSTTLAPLNPNCRVIFRGASESGGCGDLLFSGHGTVVTSVACLVWTQTQPRVSLAWKLLVTIAALHSMWASAVERFHYTADMVLAVIVTVLVFLVLDPVTGYSQRRTAYTPAPIKVKHLLVPLLVAPALYLACHLLGVLH